MNLWHKEANRAEKLLASLVAALGMVGAAGLDASKCRDHDRRCVCMLWYCFVIVDLIQDG